MQDQVKTGTTGIRFYLTTQGNIWIANNFRGMLKFDGISDQLYGN